MKQTVYQEDFIRAFKDAGRDNQFSREALIRIYEWIQENEENEGREWDLDVIALCCELSEMSLNEVIEAYDIEIDPDQNIYMQVCDYIDNHSTFLGDTESGNLVFVQF